MENITRFVVISKKRISSVSQEKSTVVFSTPHTPGALCCVLESFAYEHINLTRLESIPIKEKPWEYMFLADFEGREDELKVKRALQAIKKRTTWFKMLGSYDIGVLYE